jgi:hypothetical protein
MLDFIVLGIVPGTHIIITFTWALFLAGLFTGYLLVHFETVKLKSLPSTPLTANQISRRPHKTTKRLRRPA